MRATNINMMAIILREEDWDCAALPLGVLRGADAAEEGRFSRCRSLLLSLWGGKQRVEKGEKRVRGVGGRRKGVNTTYTRRDVILLVVEAYTLNWLFSEVSLSTLSCSILTLCQVSGWVRGSEMHAKVTRLTQAQTTITKWNAQTNQCLAYCFHLCLLYFRLQVVESARGKEHKSIIFRFVCLRAQAIYICTLYTL